MCPQNIFRFVYGIYAYTIVSSVAFYFLRASDPQTVLQFVLRVWIERGAFAVSPSVSALDGKW